MGLERNPSDGILWLLSTMVRTADQNAFARPRVGACVDELRAFAAAAVDGGLFDFVYMNYADGSQDVLAGYGAENLEFMRRVAARYDPRQVFQKLCPGGFKLPEAGP